MSSDPKTRPSFIELLNKWGPWQIITLIIAIILLWLVVKPNIDNWYTENIFNKPQSWDEDNETVLEDKIKKEGKLIKKGTEEKEVIVEYINSLKFKSSALMINAADSQNTIDLLYLIQPGKVIDYYKDNNPFTQFEIKDEITSINDTKFGREVGLYNEKYSVVYANLLSALNIKIQSHNDLPTAFAFTDQVLYFKYDFTKADSSKKEVINEKNIISSYSQDLIGIVNSIIAVGDMRVKQLTKIITDAENSRRADIERYKSNNQNINKYAVIIGIPLFIIAVLLMYYYGFRSSNRIKELVENKGLNADVYRTSLTFTLSGITVLLLILSLLILGLASVIKDNGLAALFGAIAGYVLNNASNSGSGPTTSGGGATGSPTTTSTSS